MFSGVTNWSTSAQPSRIRSRVHNSGGTGLYFYRARYYHPQLQRFVSEDPLGLGGGVNVFAYAANAPTVYTDPFGLKPSPGFGQPPSGAGGAGGPGGQGGPGGPNGPGGPGDGPDGPPGPDKPPRCSGGPGGGPGAVGGTVIFDAFGVGVGPAVSWAYVPATGERFIAGGIGLSVGHNISFGPLVGPNPSGVLPGWSFGAGYNATFARGVQGVINSSGALGGNSFGVRGASATLTYGVCF